MKKNRDQLIEELVKLRKRIAELERSEQEHRRVEEELRTSESRYRFLFEAHGAPIAVVDKEGIFLAASPVSASNFGLEASDLIGTSIRTLFPDEADVLLERHRRIIDSGEGNTFEEAFRFPDGERWYLSEVQPAKDGTGTIYGVMLITHEITERKRAEKELRESEERFRGRTEHWEVVGIFKFVGREGILGYIPLDYAEQLTGLSNESYSFRIVTETHDRATQDAMAKKVDLFMREEGFRVRSSQAGLASLDTASESLDTLVMFLLIMAVLTAVVGSMGLTARWA